MNVFCRRRAKSVPYLGANIWQFFRSCRPHFSKFKSREMYELDTDTHSEHFETLLVVNKIWDHLQYTAKQYKIWSKRRITSLSRESIDKLSHLIFPQRAQAVWMSFLTSLASSASKIQNFESQRHLFVSIRPLKSYDESENIISKKTPS